MRLAQTHTAAARQGGVSQMEGPPGLDAIRAGSYFPDSRVASHGEWVSPVSQRGNGGPAPTPNDVLLVPAGGDSPWQVPVPSEEQGFGRSPGQQWPWQVLGVSLNFDQLAIMPFEQEQTSAFDPPGGWAGRNPPERPPVFAYQVGGQPYYEQTEGFVTSDIDQIAVTEDPQQAAFTIGWGALDTQPQPGDDQSAYGEVW